MNQCKRCGAITVCVDCYPDSDAAKAMAGLTWTDAKPTVPGWYWHRSQAGQRADIGYYQDEQILLDGCLEWVIHLKGQFAGPIPQPEEPRQ